MVDFGPRNLCSTLPQPRCQESRNRHVESGAQKVFILQLRGHCRRYPEGERKKGFAIVDDSLQTLRAEERV